MLSHLYAKHIGFVALPGCHDADLINIQTILTFHPRNYYYFIGNDSSIPCQSGLNIRIDTNLSEVQRKKLDVLVIVGYDEETIRNDDSVNKVTEVLKELAISSKQVIAVGDGVLVLAKTGLLIDHRVYCEPRYLQEKLQPLVGEIVTSKNNNDNVDENNNSLRIPTVCESGKFITAGPCTGAIEAALLVQTQLRGTFIGSLGELATEYAPKVRFATTPIVKPNKEQPTLKVGVLLTHQMFLPDVIGALSVFKALPNCEVIGIVVEEESKRDIFTMWGPTIDVSSTTTTVKDCPQLDVFVVGLIMPWVLCHPAIVEFVRNQAKGFKAMIGVCAGSLLLGSAGLLNGIHATTNFQMKPILSAVGAISRKGHEEDLVVVDDKKFIYTAGPIIGSYEAAIMVVANLYGDGVAAYIERNVLYSTNPHPPFKVGHASKASRGLLLAAKLTIVPVNPIFRYCAKKGLAMTRRDEDNNIKISNKRTKNAGVCIAGIIVAIAAALGMHVIFQRRGS